MSGNIMDALDALQFEEMPNLRNPYLLLTFAGWSDAAEVSTEAGSYLIEHFQAERFAWIDPEIFYSFGSLRPQALYNDAGQREIEWPANEFFACQQPDLERDIIIGVGVEPHLRWRTFTNLMVEFIKRCNVYQTFTLGALWADVLYSAPVQLSGSATDSEVAERLGLGSGSRYEGPTGMVGVLHDTLRRQNFSSASVWANVPYYVSVSPNPKGILALVRRGLEVVGLPTALPDLEEESRDFESRIAEAINKDPKIAAHVRDLERHAKRHATASSLESEPKASGDDLAAEFERFLRDQRRQQEED
jgi:proteasome assembly chaperone (PAC2) family protein